MADSSGFEKYLYSFALFSTLILVIVSPIITDLGLTPPHNSVSGVSKIISASLSIVTFTFGFFINGLVTILRYAVIGLLNFFDGMTLYLISWFPDTAIPWAESFFGQFIFPSDDISEYLTSMVDAYSVLPTPLITVLLAPIVLTVGLSILKAVRG